MQGLIERSSELEALAAATTQAISGSGAVVVVEAAAGLGKTVLLDSAAQLAAAEGCEVRRAAPAPLESRLGYATLRTLFERPLRSFPQGERAALAGGSASHACALLLEGHAPGADGVAMVAHGMLWIIATIAERGPLAVIVDDAHWADRYSLEVLAYVAHRLDDLPVVLIVGARPDEPDTSDLITALGNPPHASLLSPPPLSTGGSLRLIRTHAPELPVGVCHGVHSATGGNPWLLLELARQLDAHGPSLLDDDDWPISDITRNVVRRRLVALTPPARAVAGAVAVLGNGAAPHLVARIAAVPMAEVGPARDLLAAAGLFLDGELRFTHGLVTAAVLADLAPAARGCLHREAARALQAESGPVDLVASHLLHTEPNGDREVSEALLRAAAEAADRGAPRSAIPYIERALTERASGDNRPQMLALLATATFDAGLPGAGLRLSEALTEVRSADFRVTILTRLAVLAVFEHGGDDALPSFIETGDGDDLDLAARLAVEAAALDALLTMPGGFADRARRLDAITPHADAAAELAPVLYAHRAWVATELGTPSAKECARLAREALRAPGFAETCSDRAAYHLCVRALTMTDHHDEARSALAELRNIAMARGSLRLRAIAEWYDAELGLRLGHVREAENHARMTLAVMDERNMVTGGAIEVLLTTLAERGAFGEAEELLEERDLAGDIGDSYWETGVRHARARLWAAQGDHERAYHEAGVAGKLRVGQGRPNPTWTAWRSTCALALAHSGRLDEAAAVAAEELQLAERFGAPLPIAVALHACCVAEADDTRRIALARQGLALVEESGPTAARVRLDIELGHAILASGQRVEARPSLRRALADADALGLTLLAARARRELVASGLRPRRAAVDGIASLTPRQRQVCELAAGGRPNRAIAHELFLSVKTVETHLATAFRKLGIGTRAELGELLGSG